MRLPRLALATALTLTMAAPGCRLRTEPAPTPTQATAPAFSLPAHDGRAVSLDELVARGPAILVFYRGYW